MSMNLEIAQSIFKGMRRNIKNIILPELSTSFSIGQAVSIYVLLKAIGGYTSPDFMHIMSESNQDLGEVFKEIDKLYCSSHRKRIPGDDKLCSAIKRQIEPGASSGEPESRNREMNKILCRVLKAIAIEVERENEFVNNIREKIRWGLRRQLDRELSLLT